MKPHQNIHGQLREDTELEMMLNMMFAAVFVIAIVIANILLLAVMWKYKLIQPCYRLIYTMIAISFFPCIYIAFVQDFFLVFEIHFFSLKRIIDFSEICIQPNTSFF